jgi:NADH-quinone oxidoreductase subunit I
MAMKEEDIQWVEEPSIGLWEAMYLPAIIEGLATTIRHTFQKPVTEEYPEVKPNLPANYRGVHRLNRDDQGRVKCVACMLCATVCPAHCIDIVGAESPWADRDKYPSKFDIDELRCIYCGMCEEVCPVDAIELTSIYDLTGLSRKEMIFDREKLLHVFDETVKSGKDPVRTSRGMLGPCSELVASPLKLPNEPSTHVTPGVNPTTEGHVDREKLLQGYGDAGLPKKGFENTEK